MSGELDKLKKQAESMRCPHLIHEIRQEDILIGSHSECRGAIFSPTPHSLATENARLREACEAARAIVGSIAPSDRRYERRNGKANKLTTPAKGA